MRFHCTHAFIITVNPIALRKVKIVYNFGLSECNTVKSAQYDLNTKERTVKLQAIHLF